MNLLKRMECPTSSCYCGSACFCSLLSFTNLLPEEEREDFSSLLLRMVELDGTYFLAGEEEKRKLLPEVVQGYRDVLSFVQKLQGRAQGPALRRKLHADETFLGHLLELVVEG